MKKHKCKPAEPHCTCYMLADEPSWDCPIHGGAIVNRCDCGRFVRPHFYEEPPSTNAVDPSAQLSGKPTPRV
jgi:hypothetical protein